MKYTAKIIALCLLSLCVLFAASCSVKNPEPEISTVQSTAEETSSENLEGAIDAFINMTEAVFETVAESEEYDYGSDETEDSEEETAEETEKPTMYIPVSHTSPLTEIFTDKIIEETTKSMTQEATGKKTVQIGFAEGRTLTEIFEILDEYEVADFDELMETAASYDYSYYPLVAKIPSNPNRCFKLEGYLFPSTYEFYTNSKPQDAIGKFLRGGKANITEQMMAQASALGYTMDEVLTVASIVEKEGGKSSEVAKIAAVIYNRLEAGMKLQMDSSIYYIERHVKPYLSGDVNRYNSYYNTYKCSALPAGPICNPGLKTINAALNPADVDYLYFCHDENANYYYAETYEEHLENLKLAGIE